VARKGDQGVEVEQQDIRGLRVSDIAHEEWPTLDPDETVEGAIKLFAESGISGAPVVEDRRLVGIVTEGDLIFRDADIKAPGFWTSWAVSSPGKLGRVPDGGTEECRGNGRRGHDDRRDHGLPRHQPR
jgi:hypothetical protein